MPFLRDYAAYIFDLDGTLADSAADVIACMRGAMAAQGLPEVDVSPLTIGPPLDQMYRTLFPDLTDSAIQSLVGSYRELYNSMPNPVTRLYPGIPDVLRALRGRGATLFVATNKVQSSTELLLTRLGVRADFSALMCSDSRLDTLGRKLTKAEMIRELLQAFSLEPDRAVMIGDSPYDIAGGREAGVHTMAVLYGYGRPEIMRGTGAEYFVEDPHWNEYISEQE